MVYLHCKTTLSRSRSKISVEEYHERGISDYFAQTSRLSLVWRRRFAKTVACLNKTRFKTIYTFPFVVRYAFEIPKKNMFAIQKFNNNILWHNTRYFCFMLIASGLTFTHVNVRCRIILDTFIEYWVAFRCRALMRFSNAENLHIRTILVFHIILFFFK